MRAHNRLYRDTPHLRRQQTRLASLPCLPLCLMLHAPFCRCRAQIDKRDFLKPDSTIDVLFWNGKAIDVQVPSVVILKVTEAAPGAKGNTAGGRTEKPVTLETGASLMVPMFIEEGEMVRVDTDEKKYLGRSNE